MEINTPCLSFNVSSLHLLSYIPLLSTESTEVQVPVQGDGSGHATRGQQAGVWGVNGAVAVGGVLPGHHELLLQNRVQAVATTYWWGPPLLWPGVIISGMSSVVGLVLELSCFCDNVSGLIVIVFHKENLTWSEERKIDMKEQLNK